MGVKWGSTLGVRPAGSQMGFKWGSTLGVRAGGQLWVGGQMGVKWGSVLASWGQMGVNFEGQMGVNFGVRGGLLRLYCGTSGMPRSSPGRPAAPLL